MGRYKETVGVKKARGERAAESKKIGKGRRVFVCVRQRGEGGQGTRMMPIFLA